MSGMDGGKIPSGWHSGATFRELGSHDILASVLHRRSTNVHIDPAIDIALHILVLNYNCLFQAS